MILAIDIGNTNICIGGLEGMNSLFSFRMVTRPTARRTSTRPSCGFFCGGSSSTPDECEGAILCSVVPALSNALAEAVYRLTGHEPAAGGPCD